MSYGFTLAAAHYRAPGGEDTPPSRGWAMFERKYGKGEGDPRPEIWVMTGPEGLTTDQFLELWKSPREEETQDFIILNGKYRKEIMLKTDSRYCSGYWDLTSGLDEANCPWFTSPSITPPMAATLGMMALGTLLYLSWEAGRRRQSTESKMEKRKIMSKRMRVGLQKKMVKLGRRSVRLRKMMVSLRRRSWWMKMRWSMRVSRKR